MERSTAMKLGIAASLILGAGAAHAGIYTQVITNSTGVTPGELVPLWGGTPFVSSPSIALGGFDSRSGARTLIDVEVFARVTFSNIKMEVLNVSQLAPGPMVAAGSSGFGATVDNPFVLMQPIKAWASNPIDPSIVPTFGFTGEIDFEFEATVDLTDKVDHTMVLTKNSYNLHVSALLDARTVISQDGSLVAISSVNDVAEWNLTFDVWAEYTYSELPAPGSSLALAGLGLFAARRRR